ncbi:MAG TPA: hypothetical protein VHD62_02300 [Opitutaceae bacterium]|nr:hypothetical protein [Opitutaceae bacterium]
MTTLELPPAAPATVSWEEELFALELRVARRADELARGYEASRARDLQVWFEAERELLDGAGFMRAADRSVAN